MNSRYAIPLLSGFAGILGILGLYFIILTLVSGWSFAQNQFFTFWYFITSLAAGFGVQVGLYVYTRGLLKDGQRNGKVLGVTGAASTGAMISCCAHYLVNVLPILGVAGLVTFVAQYQIELFWIGILFNLGGITYMVRQAMKYKRA